jgi:RNA polymerase sigma-70 factor (ECF subfamily)
VGLHHRRQKAKSVKENVLNVAARLIPFQKRAVPYESAVAFGALYDRAYLPVYRYIYGLTGGPTQEAEDLTAETFLRAWRARRRFVGDEDAAVGWLIQIARNLVIDSHRRRNNRPLDGDIEQVILAAPDASPEEQAAIAEQSQILWELLHQLPDDQREILVLRYMLGWPVKRIAGHFNLLENTVSVKLRRILERLRREWPQDGEENHDS